MAKIQPITFPILGQANDLLLRVLPFDMDAKTARFYYELRNIQSPAVGDVKIVVTGELEMTESEYNNWGADNSYCLQWAANKLQITLI